MTLCDLDEYHSHLLRFPVIVRRFSHLGRHSGVRFDHKGFEHYKDKTPGSFDIVIWFESALLYAYLGSHEFLFCPDDVWQAQTKAQNEKSHYFSDLSGHQSRILTARR